MGPLQRAVADGAIGALWFALWRSAGGALVGVWLALASSLALLAGGLVWLAEALREGANVAPAFARARPVVLRSPR